MKWPVAVVGVLLCALPVIARAQTPTGAAFDGSAALPDISRIIPPATDS